MAGDGLRSAISYLCFSCTKVSGEIGHKLGCTETVTHFLLSQMATAARIGPLHQRQKQKMGFPRTWSNMGILGANPYILAQNDSIHKMLANYSATTTPN